MSKAISTPIMKKAAALSIANLGLALASVVRERNRLSNQVSVPETQSEHNALDLLLARQEALGNAISTLPAFTVSDAAVQLGVAFTYADLLEAGNWTDQTSHDVLIGIHKALRRLMLSALPIVADVAGYDHSAMGWDDADAIRASVFFSAEQAA